MDARRIFQTTLVHPLRPEFSVAALFLETGLPAGIGADTVCRTLGIEPLSGGDISHEELRRVLACLLMDSLEVFDMSPRAFLAYVNKSGIDAGFMEHALAEARLVIARGAEGNLPFASAGGQSGLAARTLDGLLADSLAAGFGLYALSERDRMHDMSGQHQIEILYLILRGGLLIASSQRGLDRALHFGLHERLHQAFVAPQVPGMALSRP